MHQEAEKVMVDSRPSLMGAPWRALRDMVGASRFRRRVLLLLGVGPSLCSPQSRYKWTKRQSATPCEGPDCGPSQLRGRARRERALRKMAVEESRARDHVLGLGRSRVDWLLAPCRSARQRDARSGGWRGRGASRVSSVGHTLLRSGGRGGGLVHCSKGYPGPATVAGGHESADDHCGGRRNDYRPVVRGRHGHVPFLAFVVTGVAECGARSPSNPRLGEHDAADGAPRRSLRVIRPNIIFALTVKATFMVLAFAHVATLWGRPGGR